MSPELAAQIQILAEEALATFGPTEQIAQLGEECCELAVECSHRRRGRGDDGKFIAELADVMLMVEQAKMLVDEGDLEAVLWEKLKKQKKRIQEHRRSHARAGELGSEKGAP